MQPNTFFKQKERLMQILESCNLLSNEKMAWMLLISIRWWWSGCLQEGEFKRHAADVGGETRSIGISGLGWWFGKQEKISSWEKAWREFLPFKRAISSFCWFPSSYDLYVVLSGPVLYLQPASGESQNFSWWQESMVHFIKLRCAVLRSIVEWKNRKKVMPGMHAPESAPHREILGARVY